MNTDLVDDNLKTTDELREAFLKHKDNKDLFKKPVRFKRIGGGINLASPTKEGAEPSASVQGQEIESDIDWASLELKVDALKTWGQKRYTYSARKPGQKTASVIGEVMVGTNVTEDAVVFLDSFQITDRKQSLDINHYCRKDNFLSPSRIECAGDGGNDEFRTFRATVVNGKAKVLLKDPPGMRTLEIPDGTITMAAMLRLVTLVPRTPGKTYSYKYSLESEELNLKKKYRLTVLQPETITIDDRQVECSKFKLTGGGISPVYYWVTKDGVLQRLMMDDRKVMELIDTP